MLRSSERDDESRVCRSKCGWWLAALSIRPTDCSVVMSAEPRLRRPPVRVSFSSAAAAVKKSMMNRLQHCQIHRPRHARLVRSMTNTASGNERRIIGEGGNADSDNAPPVSATKRVFKLTAYANEAGTCGGSESSRRRTDRLENLNFWNRPRKCRWAWAPAATTSTEAGPGPR